MLNVKRDLIGKTITGIVAVPGREPDNPAEIWMMQFSDGSHIEFVSPSARRGLKRWSGSAANSRQPRLQNDPQLSLNVA